MRTLLLVLTLSALALACPGCKKKSGADKTCPRMKDSTVLMDTTQCRKHHAMDSTMCPKAAK